MPRVNLNGIVVSNDDARLYRWFGFEACCPNDVRQAIENCPEEDELVFEVNSGGGSVYAGFEMYNLIRNCGRKTVAEVYSIAASAASVIASACDTVLMAPVSTMMIHRATFGGTGGNAEKFRQTAQMLDTIDNSILTAYEEKSAGKSSRTQLRHMMKNETFLTAQEAIDCGLADGFIEKPDLQGGADPMNAVASMEGNCLVNLGLLLAKNALPPVEDLRRMAGEYENTEETEESEENMETIEALEAAYPELVEQIRQDAAQAERKRVSEIDAVALPGYEHIVDAAKADPMQNAASVAMAIIAAQKKQGDSYLADIQKDVAQSKVNDVGSAAEQETGAYDTESAEEKATALAKFATDCLKGGKK